MGDKSATQVPVKDFRSHEDDFDEWVELLEDAVKLAHNGTDAAGLEILYKTWLRLKLDDKAKVKYESVDKAASWTNIKKQFRELLVDPQEKYN